MYIADGYGNRRVIVVDRETGKYKRHWGAFGKTPSDEKVPAYTPDLPESKHFNDEAQRYASGALREVYFWPDQLRGHTEREYHP